MSPRPPRPAAVGATARFRRDRSRKRLKEFLSRSDDAQFLRLIWAVDLLQDSSPDVGSRFVRAPREAVGVTFGDKRFAYKWYLEDLANELLTTPKLKPRAGPFWRLDCTRFESFSEAYNTIHDLEDAEDGLYLDRRDVLQEMPRIGHRQFDWQQPALNTPNFYRAAALFGQDACREYYQAEHGLAPADMILLGMGLWALFGDQPSFDPANIVVREVGLTPEIVRAGLPLLSGDISRVQVEAVRLRQGNGQVAYRPSVLRQTPCISIPVPGGRRTVAPLRELILRRVTTGLYYDLVGGPDAVRTEMGRLFEDYCVRLLAELFDGPVSGSLAYRFRRNPIDTPDILVGPHDDLQLVVECKATRMTFDARFAQDRAEPMQRGIGELVKGVGQIWRLKSHARRGLVPLTMSPNCTGLILTFDPWLRASHGQSEEVLERAREWCAQADPDVGEEDYCPIAFTHVEDFEAMALRTDSEGMISVCRIAAEPQFIGWGMAQLRKQASATEVSRPYPFKADMARLLPWWDQIRPT